jgi:hypothetical protein
MQIPATARILSDNGRGTERSIIPTEMELTASPDECEDLVQRYGRMREGTKRMTLEGIADTLWRVRAGTIDAGNGFVRRYLLSLSSDQAVRSPPSSE